MAPPRALVLDENDNVAVALCDLEPGELLELDGRTLEVREPIRAGHKLALAPIAAGEAVVKYGETIGIATASMGAGEHAHVHNVVSARLPGAASP